MFCAQIHRVVYPDNVGESDAVNFYVSFYRSMNITNQGESIDVLARAVDSRATASVCRSAAESQRLRQCVSGFSISVFFFDIRIDNVSI